MTCVQLAPHIGECTRVPHHRPTVLRLLLYFLFAQRYSRCRLPAGAFSIPTYRLPALLPVRHGDVAPLEQLLHWRPFTVSILIQRATVWNSDANNVPTPADASSCHLAHTRLPTARPCVGMNVRGAVLEGLRYTRANDTPLPSHPLSSHHYRSSVTDVPRLDFDPLSGTTFRLHTAAPLRANAARTVAHHAFTATCISPLPALPCLLTCLRTAYTPRLPAPTPSWRSA